MASSREVVMNVHSDIQKHGLWNRFSNDVAAQVMITLVVVVILIGLAAKYIW
jgi:hypothetical protein